MIDAECPSCGHATQAPDEFAGRRVKCPRCQEKFELPSASAFAPPAAAVHDAEAESLAPLLRTLIAEVRDGRAELKAIVHQTKRTAFWTMVVGLPILCAILLVVLGFFMGFGGAMRDAFTR